MAKNYFTNILDTTQQKTSTPKTTNFSLKDLNRNQGYIAGKQEPKSKLTLGTPKYTGTGANIQSGPKVSLAANTKPQSSQQTSIPQTSIPAGSQNYAANLPTVNPNANSFNQGGSQPAQQQPQQPTRDTSYGGLIRTLTERAQDRGDIEQANKGLLDLRNRFAQKVGAIETTPIPLEFQQGRTQVLGRQFATQEAAQQQALQNALTARSQELGALGTAAGLMSPRSADIYVDPTTGQPIGDVNNIGQGLAQWASIRSGAQTAGQFTQDYQQGLANLRASDSIGNQIISTLQANPSLNTQALSFLTNLNQMISGQLGSAPQQLLAQQVNQYIQTLGLDENTVMNIASQQQGTLGQLLDSLREMKAAEVESFNPQNIINNPQGINKTTGSGGGQIINTAVGPIDNSWF